MLDVGINWPETAALSSEVSELGHSVCWVYHKVRAKQMIEKWNSLSRNVYNFR